MCRSGHRPVVLGALGLLSMTAFAGCGSHTTTGQSHDQLATNYHYRFDNPATTTCSRIVEYAVDDGPVSNVGDCAGHLNITPALTVELNVGQHLYLYIGRDSKGQLSTPTPARSTVLRLIHHSSETIAYTAATAGQTRLAARSSLCADAQSNHITRCTLLQVDVDAKS